MSENEKDCTSDAARSFEVVKEGIPEGIAMFGTGRVVLHFVDCEVVELEWFHRERVAKRRESS